MDCQDGKIACANAKKAKIEISIDGNIENLLFDAPACVRKEEISEDASANNIKCWKFFGMTGDVITSMHYVCGKNAYFQPGTGLLHNGAWLVVDGKIQVGRHYYYWSGVNKDNGEIYRRFVEPATEVSGVGYSGNCDTCLEVGCQIIVTNEAGAIYKSKKGSKCDFKIACDDECPPGFIKCLKPSYPGYCCIDCSEIKSEIAALRGALKR